MMYFSFQSNNLEGKKGRCELEVLRIPDHIAFLAKDKTLSFVFQANYSLLLYNPDFYRTKFNDCSRQLYKIAICFRSAKISLNLSDWSVLFKCENPAIFLYYLTLLHDVKYFTVSTSRCCFTSHFNNQATEENWIRRLQRRVAEHKQQLTVQKRLNDKPTPVPGL